ncbi:unnamed protein product [Adineta ricciae]|uniref:Uncharacterized protein n=1 Tax=Adineta ricciae TaxID=249248 RepID=A0A813XLF9_ADIRI|nr:unnamed protein product [Adineta ricciae]
MAYNPASIVYPYPYETPLQPPAIPLPYSYPMSTGGPAQTVHVYNYDEPPKYSSVNPKSKYQVPPQTISHTPPQLSSKSSKQPHLKSVQQKPVQSPAFSIYDNHANSVVNDNLDELPTLRAASTQTTKCYQSKPFRVALLLTLLALIVIAAVVPLVVLVVKTNTSTTTAAPACARTYSATFSTSTSSTASDCATWQAFTAGLTCSSYSTMRIYGTNNPTGITITSASVVTGLAAALRANSTYTGTAGGYTWAVGVCGSGLEITSTGSVCGCSSGYTIRSCIYNNNWGGINGATCSASGQTVSLYFA